MYLLLPETGHGADIVGFVVMCDAAEGFDPILGRFLVRGDKVVVGDVNQLQAGADADGPLLQRPRAPTL